MTHGAFDLAQTDKLLTRTRSVRKRLDLAATVDLDVIQECIGLACQAPTGGNVQDWRWVVVTSATGPSHDHCDVSRPSGTSSGERWYRAIVPVVAHAK